MRLRRQLFCALALNGQLDRLYFFVEIEDMHQNGESVLLFDEGPVETVKIVVLSRNKMVNWVLDTEDILKFPKLVTDLCLVVHLD